MNDPVVDPKLGLRLSEPWRRWFGRMASMLSSIPNVMNTTTLTAQAASLSSTDFANTTLEAGLYRATYRVQITQAATTSSSLIVTFSWTDGGVAQSAVGDTITGNTTTTGQSDSIVIRVDAGTPIYYSTTYASVGLTPMQYSFSAILEKIKR